MYYGMIEQVVLEEKGIDCLDWEKRIENRNNTVVFNPNTFEQV